MEIRIDFNDKEKAAQQIAGIQESFDEIIRINNEARATLKDNSIVIDDCIEKLNTLQTANGDLVQTLKNIHIMLNARVELFAKDEEMRALIETLGTFVTSSGAIKAGVIREHQK